MLLSDSFDLILFTGRSEYDIYNNIVPSGNIASFMSWPHMVVRCYICLHQYSDKKKLLKKTTSAAFVKTVGFVHKYRD